MSAERIGKKLELAMERQGMTLHQLAERTGKGVDHLKAVLAGYPNSKIRPTQLDTVDQIAAALGLKLDLSPAD